jgi:glycosyltransferase involved in cell wall biosynthesis
MKRVCVLTSGHLASTPRMLKAADALHEAGYAVRVICAEHVDWCITAGNQLRAARRYPCDIVFFNVQIARSVHWRSRIRHKALRVLSKAVGPACLGLRQLASAGCRVGKELVGRVMAEPTDLIYAGTASALGPAALAARRLGVPYALDLEDFHSAEQDPSPDARLAHHIMEEVEKRVLPGAAFLTAGSQPMAEAYAAKYDLPPLLTVNNVFPLPPTEPALAPRGPAGLRMVWLSQTVGPNRGLEDAIHASGLAAIRGELDVRGYAVPGYFDDLVKLAGRVAPQLTLRSYPPDPHRSPEEICLTYDVGLALEQAHVLNRDLCLCNKPFTYLIAGLAVAATDTRGQRPLIQDLGEGGFLYKPGDVATFATGLRRWAHDDLALVRAKRAAWEAAKRRWHWEHPQERGAMLDAVAKVLPR